MANLNQWSRSVTTCLKKYKFAILVLLLGIVFLLLPGGEKKENTEKPEQQDAREDYAQMMEDKMKAALAQINGVGNVEVVLTLESGWMTHYLFDIQTHTTNSDDSSSSTEEKKAVILSEGSAYDEAAVTTVEYPRFQGALIVCDGGDQAKVKLEVVQAVSALTGLSSDRITIVKMK